MNPVTETTWFVCSRCRRDHATRPQAEACCVCHCGATTHNGHVKCPECERATEGVNRARRQRDEVARIDALPKVPWHAWDKPVSLRRENGTECLLTGFHCNVAELRHYVQSEADLIQEGLVVLGCSVVHTGIDQHDIDSMLENALSETHDGAEFENVAELEAFVLEWGKRNAVESWFEDSVRLDMTGYWEAMARPAVTHG